MLINRRSFLYHRDEGDFKSLSEVLIEEGMAAPEKILQPQDEAGNVLPELSHVLPCSRKLKKGQLFSENRHN